MARTADSSFSTSIEAVGAPIPLGGGYATGDVIGTGWYFPSCVRSNGSFFLTDLTLIDPTNAKIQIDVLLFEGHPADQVDSAAVGFSLYDSRAFATIPILISDWVTYGAEAIADVKWPISRKINQAELYFLPVARGTLTATKLRIFGGFVID